MPDNNKIPENPKIARATYDPYDGISAAIYKIIVISNQCYLIELYYNQNLPLLFSTTLHRAPLFEQTKMPGSIISEFSQKY